MGSMMLTRERRGTRDSTVLGPSGEIKIKPFTIMFPIIVDAEGEAHTNFQPWACLKLGPAVCQVQYPTGLVIRCFSFSLKSTLFNPNLHSPLKLRNYHGLDGKSWFKKQGPLWVIGSDYKVLSIVFPPFSDCTMSNAPPPPASPSTGKKRGKHL